MAATPKRATPIASLREFRRKKNVELRLDEFRRLADELFPDDQETSLAWALKVDRMTTRRWLLNGTGLPASAVICLRAYLELRAVGKDFQPLLQGLSAR